MSDNIDWNKVHIEGHSAQIAADYLKKNPDNAKDIFYQLHRSDNKEGITHFEIPHDGIHRDISHHFTLVKEDGKIILRPKSTGLLS